MRNVRAGLGIIHGVSKFADQNTRFPPIGHLLDGKRAIQNTHVDVDAHEEKVLDAFLLQEPVNLHAVI